MMDRSTRRPPRDERYRALLDQSLSEQRRLTEELRQAQKMEAVGQLAGGIAHDFNNLLTAIIGYSELVRDGLGPSHRFTRDVQAILNAAGRAESLTRQLLAFSRKQILRPEVLDLNLVVREFADLLTRLIGDDIRIQLSLAPSVRPLRADRGQLEQVIMNLAVNARDAMPSGGTLTIETRDEHPGDGVVGDGPRASAAYTCLVLSDTGIGMSAETRARIFEPFFTTKGNKGTGLGLSTACGIVEQSGGRIAVHSEPGVGTTFRVYLPALEMSPERPAAEVQPDADDRGGTETVMIVEDDPGVRHLSVKALARRGYTVLEAAAADEALEIADRHSDRIHALVTDLVMPGLDGHALAELMSLTRRELRVVYSSGYSPAVVSQHGVRVGGGRAFIQKPYSGVRLARVVRSLLDHPMAS